MTILSFPSRDSEPDDQPAGAELVTAPRTAPQSGAVRGWLERQPGLPDRQRLAASARWWTREGAKKLFTLALCAPWLALRELRPITRGLGRCFSIWAKWCAVADVRDLLSDGEGNPKLAAGLKREARRSGRRRMSLALAVLLAGVGVWAYCVFPAYLAAAGFVLVGVFDLVGRRGTEKVATPLPAPARTVLREGVPLNQITATIVDTAAREGLEIGIASPMRYDSARREYRVQISCLDLIEPKHLRAFERGIGAEDHAVRSLATDMATTRELVIRDGDPLAEVPAAPWIDTGSISLQDDLLDLGVSMTEVDFALSFAGQHVKVIMGTGGGKSTWFLRNCIDRLSACRDVVIWGIDLTNGPELPLWRGVIQKRAFTPDDAEVLLGAALAEIGRRAKILAGFAEDDDPSNDDIIEWCSKLGPWLDIVIDEFSTLAEYNGKPQGELDLLGQCKEIIRTGRKHGVSLVMLAQRTGNEDFGSTVMTSQAGVTIAGPCAPDDSVRAFGKDKRDDGWTPHILKPGTKDSPNDAGKCFVESPRHRTPDIYRCYAPMSAGEVKRRARQRIADGLPSLQQAGSHGDLLDEVEGAIVPPVLAAVEQAFAEAGNPEWMATADLLSLVQAAGFPELTETTLAAGIPVDKNEPGSRRRRTGEKNPTRGYLLSSIRSAMEQL